jgi:hypothetical protein
LNSTLARQPSRQTGVFCSSGQAPVLYCITGQKRERVVLLMPLDASFATLIARRLGIEIEIAF